MLNHKLVSIVNCLGGYNEPYQSPEHASMKTIFSLKFIFILSLSVAFSQTKISKTRLHGTFFLNWGYHRDAYTKSTIHFKDYQTENYDFTLHSAKATDQPDFDDFFHRPLTVPQYVFSIGYFFNNKKDLGIEIGWDHLKYVMVDYQKMHLTGMIHGVNYDKDTLVTPKFVHYEHTNGNNYLMINALKRITLLKSHAKYNKLSGILRLGFGGLVPKTDSYILGLHNDGPFRFSGIVIGAGASVRYDLLKYFFLETSIKGSFVDYTSVKLYKEGRAKQQFLSVQYILSAGINVPLY